MESTCFQPAKEACLSGISETPTRKLLLIYILFVIIRPIELIEKQQDIFALKSTQKQLFMGCRGHSIVPMGLGYHAPFHEQV